MTQEEFIKRHPNIALALEEYDAVMLEKGYCPLCDVKLKTEYSEEPEMEVLREWCPECNHNYTNV